MVDIYFVVANTHEMSVFLVYVEDLSGGIVFKSMPYLPQVENRYNEVGGGYIC